MEQAILDLTKLVGNFVEEQKKFNAQLSQRIHTVKTSLNQKVDGLQSEIDQKCDNLQSGIEMKFDNLQKSISKLSNQQHAHQEEENLEGECMWDTMVEEQCQQGLSKPSDFCVVVCPWEKKEEILPSLSKGAVEEHQEHNLPLPPSDSVYIPPSPAAQSTPNTLAPKANASPSLLVQNIRNLEATVLAFSTTSKTPVAAHTAWHSEWFGF